MNEWIEVKVKGVPNHSETVLIAIVYKTMPGNWCRGYYRDGKWYQLLGGGFSEHGLLNITHYMEIELPTPTQKD